MLFYFHRLQCLAPAYLPLLCSAGECGLVTFGNELQCPLPCRLNTQCASCLASPRCGWCALGSLNGRGLCMEGGPGGPVAGMCSNTTVLMYNESLSGMMSTGSSRSNRNARDYGLGFDHRYLYIYIDWVWRHQDDTESELARQGRGRGRLPEAEARQSENNVNTYRCFAFHN